VSRRVELPGSSHPEPPGAEPVDDVDAGATISVSVHLRRGADGYDSRAALDDFGRFAADHSLWLRQEADESCLRLGGTHSQLALAFGTRLRLYDNGFERFPTRSGPLTLPEELVPWTLSVLGLDGRPLIPWPPVSAEAVPADGNGMWPADIARLYGIDLQTNLRYHHVAIIAMGGGYSPADLAAAAKAQNREPPPVDEIALNGVGNLFGSNPRADQELSLDVQVLAAFAPAATIAVYFAANNEDGLISAVRRAVSATDPNLRPSVVSISWGSAETFWPDGVRDTAQKAFEAAATAGVTIVAAAGDDLTRANTNDGAAHVLFPASHPLVLGCGGTAITLNQTGDVIKEEVVWNDNGLQGTGGGISDIFPIPAYQQNLPVPLAKDGRKMRGVPDVAALASGVPGYRIMFNGGPMAMLGTSAAAPLWAGIIAMANARRPRPLGALHAGLYAAHGLFREITKGSNFSGSVGFEARDGWNACTGLGVPTSATVEGLRLIP